jgi:hypothetical protein
MMPLCFAVREPPAIPHGSLAVRLTGAVPGVLHVFHFQMSHGLPRVVESCSASYIL